MEVGGCDLGTGTTFADFQIGGKWTSQSDALNMAANGSHIIEAKSLVRTSLVRHLDLVTYQVN